jgi:hypothetical protein
MVNTTCGNGSCTAPVQYAGSTMADEPSVHCIVYGLPASFSRGFAVKPFTLVRAYKYSSTWTKMTLGIDATLSEQNVTTIETLPASRSARILKTRDFKLGRPESFAVSKCRIVPLESVPNAAAQKTRIEALQHSLLSTVYVGRS